VLAKAHVAGKIDEIQGDRDQVYARYQPLFNSAAIGVDQPRRLRFVSLFRQ